MQGSCAMEEAAFPTACLTDMHLPYPKIIFSDGICPEVS